MNTHISSGVIMYDKKEGVVRVLIMKRNKTNSWHLPKGTQEKNETLEQTAIRETREETGLHVELEKYIGKLKSSFEINGETIQKETHYFLAQKKSGDTKDHDPEHDELKFVDYEKALYLLENFCTHETEARILKMAESSLLLK